MAIDPVLTSTASLRSRDRAGAEHLGDLVRTMEQVAEQLDAPGHTTSERTVLRARFHDLQRQVNRLDGIVAGEGLESSSREAVRSSPAPVQAAPAREPAVDQARPHTAAPTPEPARPTGPAAPSSGTPSPSGVDLVV